MDDFIDDSEIDCGNISAEISRIFNYDRRRYVYNDEESDDECMESSVAQQMREENRTLRIGKSLRISSITTFSLSYNCAS